MALFIVAGADASVNINTASQQQLQTLRFIGPAKAKAIAEYRLLNGPFKSREEIMRVKGIGPQTYDKLKDEIEVETVLPVRSVVRQHAIPVTGSR